MKYIAAISGRQYKICFCRCSAVFVLSLMTSGAVSQNARISMWGFSGGFSQATGSNAILRATAGQSLAASSANVNDQVRSGFLASIIASGKNLARVTVLLEGPYNIGNQMMNTTLRSGGHLANHFGSIPIPSSAVDSINIELRNNASAAAATTRKFRPAWLLADGTIRDFTDTTRNYVEFDTLAGSYHLVIRHRNHIPIMTTSTVVLDNTVLPPYDFTTSQSQAFGTNPLKALAGGRFGMVAGDANSNGQIANSDINGIIRPAIGQSGYRDADVNLNGQVQNSDINSFARPNLGRGTQVPSGPQQPLQEKEEE